MAKLYYMKNLLLLITILFAFKVTFSQEAYSSVVFIDKLIPGANIMPDLNSGIEYNGSPYLDSSFVDGQILVKKSRYISPMRYNIFLDAFEIKEGNSVIYVNCFAADTIYYNNLKFIYKKVGSAYKVFEPLSTNAQYDLMKQYRVSYQDGSFGTPGKKDIYPTFKRQKPLLYICFPDKSMKEISGIKDFRAIFPEKVKQINAFIKEKKLRKNAEPTMIMVFNFVTGLK
jgi:hypothetical protein